MFVLLGQGTPVPIRPFLVGHTVETAAQRGWDKLKNGEHARDISYHVTSSHASSK
jgi:hypothetical protein